MGPVYQTLPNPVAPADLKSGYGSQAKQGNHYQRILQSFSFTGPVACSRGGGVLLCMILRQGHGGGRHRVRVATRTGRPQARGGPTTQRRGHLYVNRARDKRGVDTTSRPEAARCPYQTVDDHI